MIRNRSVKTTGLLRASVRATSEQTHIRPHPARYTKGLPKGRCKPMALDMNVPAALSTFRVTTSSHTLQNNSALWHSCAIRSEVSAGTSAQSVAFWGLTLLSLVGEQHRFGGTLYLHLQISGTAECQDPDDHRQRSTAYPELDRPSHNDWDKQSHTLVKQILATSTASGLVECTEVTGGRRTAHPMEPHGMLLLHS